jgi:hypothetical protein
VNGNQERGRSIKKSGSNGKMREERAHKAGMSRMEETSEHPVDS